jgi:hypothetical protein
VAVIKTAFEASQTAAETLKKVAKQAADTAESNLKAAHGPSRSFGQGRHVQGQSQGLSRCRMSRP